jgi:hypothetical protein
MYFVMFSGCLSPDCGKSSGVISTAQTLPKYEKKTYYIEQNLTGQWSLTAGGILHSKNVRLACFHVAKLGD